MMSTTTRGPTFLDTAVLWCVRECSGTRHRLPKARPGAPEENVARWQHRLGPIWKRLAGGCHLDRPVEALIRDAGFEIERLQTGYMEGPRLLTFLYEGSARPQ